jgi:hypothetical protein
MAGQAVQPHASVDSALEILVLNATEEFGFAPRIVHVIRSAPGLPLCTASKYLCAHPEFTM